MPKMIEDVLWQTLNHLRGDYAADQALYTVEADAYEPNDFNLYNMAGNVSEWVQGSYDPASYEYMSTINPNVNDPEGIHVKLFVVVLGKMLHTSYK